MEMDFEFQQEYLKNKKILNKENSIFYIKYYTFVISLNLEEYIGCTRNYKCYFKQASAIL